MIIKYYENNRINYVECSNPLLEVDRRNLVGKTKAQSPARYAKRLNYRDRMISHDIDNTKFINFDMAVIRVPVGKYICTVAFRGVIHELIDVVKPQGNINLQKVIKAVTRAIDKTNLLIDCTCADWCLSGDTKIDLVDGRTLTIEELCKIFSRSRKEMNINAYSLDSSGIHNGHITDVWMTGYTDKFIDVTLDNGEHIKTTDNHQYMMSDYSYKRADKLVVGDLLMSLNNARTITNIDVVELDSVEPIYDMEVEEYHNFYVNAGVMLHNCYRYAYWASRYKYKYGRPELRPSKITNPRDNIGSMCKHLTSILANKQWMIRLSSIINDLIRNNYEQILEVYQLDPSKFYYVKPGQHVNKRVWELDDDEEESEESTKNAAVSPNKITVDEVEEENSEEES